MSYRITLTWYEQQIGAMVGIFRGADDVRRGTYLSLISGENDEVTNIQSAGAEVAVAKLINHYWNLIGTPEMPDIRKNIEVRQTCCETGRLIVRKKDHDDRIFVLVRGVMPTFEIVGWIYGRDAKQKQWLDNPNGGGECWMVPADQLQDMKLLAHQPSGNGT